MIRMKVDASYGVRCFTTLRNSVPAQLRNGLDRTARAARTAFHKLLPKELNFASGKRGMTVSTGGAETELSLAAAGALRTVFTPSRKSFNLSVVAGAKATRGEGVTAHTHTLSGKDVHSPHGFAIRGSKGVRLVHRVKWGTGTHREGYKALKTTSPAGIMAQEGNPVRRAWEDTALARLSTEMPTAINEAVRRAGF